MAKQTITRTQIDWIVMALQHDIANVRRQMDSAPDDSPTQALGELFISTREDLVRTLMDAVHNGSKTIGIE